MPNYRRDFVQGGVYFFTIALQDRTKDFLVRYIDKLRETYQETLYHYPFETIAICILPEHLHLIMQLPEKDNNFSRRIQVLKTNFSKRLPKECQGNFNQSREKRGELGIWQRRFWEHRIKDDEDLSKHIDYIYYNPVKHGYVQNVKSWLYSSFHRDVEKGIFEKDWGSNIPIRIQNLYQE
ncbi:REP-associated tyrosine transposase [Neisseria lisongii]|uniref:Transposase n=1 Tax=Neisseria lisongii TaxID=2912188 RepID=A0AAW5AD38_9NEIS|nr:transposase [Neisseria lisongii]MCF7529229.1 transposase [Neisseria lisongii]